MKNRFWKLCFIFVIGLALSTIPAIPVAAQGQQDDETAIEDQLEKPGQGDQGARGDRRDRGYYHGTFKWWERPRVVERVKITEEQRAKIRDIYDRQSKDMEPLRSDLKDQGKKLREMLVEEKLDKEQIDSQIDAVSAALAKVMSAKLQMNVQMMNELSPEQRKELIAMYEEIREKIKQRREERSGRTEK